MALRVVFLSLLFHGCASAQPFLFYRGVTSAASLSPAGLPNGQIARGSIFSLFGRAMGPAQGVSVQSFPLGNVLAGVGVEVCQDSRCVPAIPIFVRQDQINGIMPSNAPLGAVSLRVTYNNQAGNFTSATVVDRSPGIFTINSGGFGPAVAQNFESEASQPVNSQASPAKPGQTMILWATGLGPGLNADNVAPQPGNLPVSLDIWVGGRPVTVKRYQGRSGCCSGLDQIIFDLPADTPLGCYVPIQVVAGGNVVSNSPTIAVSANGEACGDSFNQVSERFRQGGRLGFVVVNRTNTHYNYGKTQPEVISENVTATFRRAQAGPFFFDPQVSLPPLGSCTVHTARGDLLGGDDLPGFFAPASELDAGTELRLGPSAVPRDEVSRLYTGEVATSLPPEGAPSTILNAVSNLSGAGGADVRSFAVSIPPPPAITWPNRAALETVSRTTDLRVTWQGGDAEKDVILVMGIGVNLAENSSAQFVCTASPAAGSFVIPQRILMAMPRVSQQTGVQNALSYLYVGRSPLRAPQSFSANGIDAGLLLGQQWAARAVLIP